MSKPLGKTAKKILSPLVGGACNFGDLLVELCQPTHHYLRSSYTMAPKRIYGSLYSLKRGKYIKQKGRGKSSQITITQKGKLEILISQIKEKSRKKRWDNKWRLVIFDILEDARKERNFLRGYLKSFGLKELQKSVWILPYDIEREFKEFLTLCNKKIEGDIRFLTVEKISFDDDFKKVFGLLSRKIKK